MIEVPDLTALQFTLADDFLSLTFAVFLGAFIFFVLSAREIAPRYRSAIWISAVIVAVAGYHYFRIFESWNSAYELVDGVVQSTGQPFNEAYRYMDWLVTVPLLVAELVIVLGLPRERRRSVLVRLVPAAALMILLGYPGELTAEILPKAIWGTLSTIPFVYILWVLFSELGSSINDQPESVRATVKNLRWILLATWGVYPLAYMIPFITDAGAAFAGKQVAYAIADITAKAGYGLLIHKVAKWKTESLTDPTADDDRAPARVA